MPLSAYYPLYAYSPKFWFIRDEPEFDHSNLAFHVSAGDYLTTLASILRFFEESIQSNDLTPGMRELQLKTIRGVIENLLYLDKHYVIRKKTKE